MISKRLAAIAFSFTILLGIAPAGAKERAPEHPVGPMYVGQGMEEVNVLLKKALASAQKTVRLQATLLTNEELIRALQAASARGVDVQALFSEAAEKVDNGAGYLRNRGIRVLRLSPDK